MNLTLRVQHFLLIPATLALVSCASVQEQSAVVQDPVAVEQPPVAETPTSEEVLSRVWAAEVFGSEGETQKAAEEYLAAALISPDPDVARRATEIAISAQSWQVAAMAASRWVTLAPEDLQARQTAARTLLVGGDFAEAELQIAETLELLSDQPWQGWRQVPPLLSAARNTDRAMSMVEYLIEETDAAANPYALYCRSRLEAREGNFAEALVWMEQALQVAPQEAELQSWAGRLALGLQDEAAALGYYETAWQLQPGERSLALVYAELLRETGDGYGANDVLATLPDTPENRFTRVAFAAGSGMRPQAESIYEGFREIPYGNTTELAFHAARSAEVLDLTEDAIAWYARLEGTERELIALLRRAYLLAEVGRLEEARDVLKFARNSGSSVVQMETLLVEAQVLIEADQSEEAFAVLKKALEQFPGDTRLLYSRAIISAQLGDVESAETDLRRVLTAEPGNAGALNALGYTLADQTDRLDEAERLIRTAFELEPEDAAIIDSMGWVAFRQGRLEEAERFLRRAFMLDRSAEIAAHLGEVLMAQGKMPQARSVWNEGLRIDPTDRVLLETLERFDVQP
jgi:tetratricopeptide (TPR) repeat protein